MKRALLFPVAIFSLLIFLSIQANADEVYSWKDSNGRIVFGNKPPSASDHKEIKAELSRYSTDKVFKRYGLTPEQKTNKNQDVELEAEAKVEDPSTSKPQLKTTIAHSEVDIQFDDKQKITFCAVELTNNGEQAASNLAVSFQFSDGSVIPANGPEVIEPGASSVYSIPNSQLPITLTKEDTSTKAPKVIIEFN